MTIQLLAKTKKWFGKKTILNKQTIKINTSIANDLKW